MAHGFLPGDQVKLIVYAYTQYGSSNTGAKLFGAAGNSIVNVVQNAGVIWVKVGNSWIEGQVHVKVNNQWIEADVVQTKVGNTWVEAE
jgi:hypothetical protein